MQEIAKRCWNGKTEPIQIEYHDKEWGVPLHDDQKFFEFLVLGGFQAGLTWWLILERREAFRLAFDNFNPKKVARYDSDDLDRLMKTPRIIHNKVKIAAAINNAKCFLSVQKEFGSFDNFIWKFVNGKVVNNSFHDLSDLPAETETSVMMSQEMKNRGFQFVGPTICYAFMQATGMVNDHLISCFRHEQVKNL